MEGATHLRCNPNTRVSITHTDNMGVAIPRLRRINSRPMPRARHRDSANVRATGPKGKG